MLAENLSAHFLQAQPTNGQIAYHSPPTGPDNNVMLAASFGESNGNSDYVESAENSPRSSANTPDLEGHISEMETTQKVSEGEIDAIV